MNVEERLARLERDNRRLKVAGLLIVSAIASVFIMGQVSTPAVIEAHRFTVRSVRGVEVASLSALSYADGESAGAWLAFHDYKPDGGQTSETFFRGGSGQEAFLQLNTENGTRVVRLRTGYDSIDPSISISTPSGVHWSAP
jgi:hypothetical protein